MRRATKKQGLDLLCQILSINIDLKTNVTTIHVPIYECPDMTRTIQAVLSIDPRCEAIHIYQDGEIDTSYELDGNEWRCYWYQKYCPDDVSKGVDL